LGAYDTIMALAVALLAGEAQAQPALSCDAESFAGLDLPATRIVSVVSVPDDPGGDVADFARFYPMPGMAHCGGGPAADRFDLFGALVDWVEHGRVPATVTASVRADNTAVPQGWSPMRTRPLCDWPKVARYRGTGDLESAASFVCE
jgi:hypothetical protein